MKKLLREKLVSVQIAVTVIVFLSLATENAFGAEKVRDAETIFKESTTKGIKWLVFTPTGHEHERNLINKKKDFSKYSHVFIAVEDLNANGSRNIFVYVTEQVGKTLDHYLFIYETIYDTLKLITPDGYNLNLDSKIIIGKNGKQNKIGILPTKTNGWHDLHIVKTKYANTILKWTGQRYDYQDQFEQDKIIELALKAKWLLFTSTEHEYERNLVRKYKHVDEKEKGFRRKVKTKIYIALHDLDDDGTNEIFAYFGSYPYCGTNGCPLFIYKRHKEDRINNITPIPAYGVTFDFTIDENGKQNEIGILPTKTLGWYDIVLAGGYIWRYDGEKYDRY